MKILTALGLNLIWIIVIFGVFVNWHLMSTDPEPPVFFLFGTPEKPDLPKELFVACLLAPVWEEAAFRWVPLTIFKKVANGAFIFPIAVLSSIIFGYMHGSPIHVWLQGYFGLISCWLFINAKKFPYLQCVVFHAIMNFIWIVGFDLIQKAHFT